MAPLRVLGILVACSFGMIHPASAYDNGKCSEGSKKFKKLSYSAVLKDQNIAGCNVKKMWVKFEASCFGWPGAKTGFHWIAGPNTEPDCLPHDLVISMKVVTAGVGTGWINQAPDTVTKAGTGKYGSHLFGSVDWNKYICDTGSASATQKCRSMTFAKDLVYGGWHPTQIKVWSPSKSSGPTVLAKTASKKTDKKRCREEQIMPRRALNQARIQCRDCSVKTYRVTRGSRGQELYQGMTLKSAIRHACHGAPVVRVGSTVSAPMPILTRKPLSTQTQRRGAGNSPGRRKSQSPKMGTTNNRLTVQKGGTIRRRPGRNVSPTVRQRRSTTPYGTSKNGLTKRKSNQGQTRPGRKRYTAPSKKAPIQRRQARQKRELDQRNRERKVQQQRERERQARRDRERKAQQKRDQARREREQRARRDRERKAQQRRDQARREREQRARRDRERKAQQRRDQARRDRERRARRDRERKAQQRRDQARRERERRAAQKRAQRKKQSRRSSRNRSRSSKYNRSKQRRRW